MKEAWDLLAFGAKLAAKRLDKHIFAEDRKKIAEAERQKAEAERQEMLSKQSEFISKYTESACSIFIDSNIWMKEEYHFSISHFCLLYSDAREPFIFQGEQYAEIQKIRKRTPAEVNGEEHVRSGAASSAVRLIRDLAKKGQLELEEAKQAPSHVDDFIVAEAKIAVKAGKKFLLVTDDVELQTRVFTIKSRGSKDLCEVLTGEELKALFSVT